MVQIKSESIRPLRTRRLAGEWVVIGNDRGHEWGVGEELHVRTEVTKENVPVVRRDGLGLIGESTRERTGALSRLRNGGGGTYSVCAAAEERPGTGSA